MLTSSANVHPTRWTIYLLAVVFAPFLMIVGIFCMSGTEWYLHHNGYPGALNMGYGLRTEGLNCDVVIYGDSSALSGLNPAIIQSITGLKTCNLSEVHTAITIVGGNYPLDKYLQHNRPPRYVVGMWGPQDFHPTVAPNSAYYPDAMMYSLRYRGVLPTLWQMTRHPSWVFHQVAWVGQQAVLTRFGMRRAGDATSWSNFTNVREIRDSDGGQLPYPFPPQTHCGAQAIDPDLVRSPEGVQAFRRRYSSAQTTVLVNVTPIPDCDDHYKYDIEMTQGLHDNQFEVLPLRYFNDGNQHFSPEGWRYLSNEVGHQILEKMKEQGN